MTTDRPHIFVFPKAVTEIPPTAPDSPRREQREIVLASLIARP